MSFLGKIAITTLKLIQNIGGLAKRAHPARARYLNVNFARRNKDLQPGGTEMKAWRRKVIVCRAGIYRIWKT
jgi:hypothetical protein